MDGKRFADRPGADKAKRIRGSIRRDRRSIMPTRNSRPLRTQLQTARRLPYGRVTDSTLAGLRISFAKICAALSPSIYPQDRQLRLEYFYNHFEAFYRAIWCYGITLVIRAFSRVRPADLSGGGRGRRVAETSAWQLRSSVSRFRQAGIVMRCMIAGAARRLRTCMNRSSGFRSRFHFRDDLFRALSGAGLFAGGVAGHARSRCCSCIKCRLPCRRASIRWCRCLRDNFWLTIHVLTITLSYAAFALAMGFGHILLWRYARNPAARGADAPMHFWLYRVLQLGVLLLAAGTILGGVWANYSWGRFWGWDPKETWALIALLCYILALHGRLAGWWTQFGLAVASVVCFLAVLMAWYGVNFVLRQRVAQLRVRHRRRDVRCDIRCFSIFCSSRSRSGDTAGAQPPPLRRGEIEAERAAV